MPLELDKLKRVAAFVLVGATAAAVHFGVVVGLVGSLAMKPLLANPVGWLVAFGVSFSGQRWLTFRDTVLPLPQAMRRFFLVSAVGFVINEAAYAWLLAHGGLGYQMALGAVLVGVAALTFVFSRRWAFWAG